MARDGSYLKLPITVTFKTSNRSVVMFKKVVICFMNLDVVLDVNTKIPGIPSSAIITHIGIGEKYTKK